MQPGIQQTGMVVPGIGKMRIDVIEAKLTRDVEVFGTMAPFVKITLLAQVFRTQANTGGGKLPKWNQVKESHFNFFRILISTSLAQMT